MAKVQMDRCENCGKIVKDWRQEAGWLQFGVDNSAGSNTGVIIVVTRSTGEAVNGKWLSEKLSGGMPVDYCSIDCFKGHLDKEVEKRDATLNARNCVVCKKPCEPAIDCSGRKYHKECHDKLTCGPKQSHA